MRSRRTSFALVLLTAASGFAGTDPTGSVDAALPHYKPGRVDSSRALHSIGSDAMVTLVKRWSEICRAAHPGLTFTYEIEQAWNSLAGLGEGRAQFAPMGRLPTKSEYLDFVERTGYVPLSIVVAHSTFSSKEWPHPHAVYVHRDNPLAKLTLTQVDAIFSKTRLRGYPTDITTWGQLGLTGEWADKTIRLYGVRGPKNSGPANYFRERALASGALKDDIVTVPSEDLLVPKIEADRYGIGFTGLPFETTGVKHLAIAETEGAPYSEGSLAEVRAGTYPLGRVIYVHVRRAPGMPLDPAVEELLRVALSREGQEAAVAEGYLPLTAAEAAKELAKLE
jgi:phosphate transport system substrate-binding protein